MATPSSSPAPLTNDLFFDAMTTGYSWLVGPLKTLNWSISNGFNREFWPDPSLTVQVLSTVFSSISQYVNLNFHFAGYFSTPVTAASASDINISLDGANLLFNSSNTWGTTFLPVASNNNAYLGAPGDAFLNLNSPAGSLPSYAPGSAGYALALHEIGHALGLKHPFDNTGGRPCVYQKPYPR